NIAEQATADAENHRPMPLDQSRKRRLVVLVDEPGQQLPIGQVTAARQQQGPTQLPHDLFKGYDCHRCPLSLLVSCNSSYMILQQVGLLRRSFSAPASWRGDGENRCWGALNSLRARPADSEIKTFQNTRDQQRQPL